MVKKAIWREYFEAILVAFVLAMLIRAFVVQAYKIPSGSMLNTLLIGDRLLVNKFAYSIKLPFLDYTLLETFDPKLGDIIVFAYPEDESIDFIKRVVALPGDTVEMRNKVLYRNGVSVKEPYVWHKDSFIYPARDEMPATTVPPGKYFVLGDNRDDSKDSRVWGFVDRDKIRGKAWRIYWSWGSEPGDGGRSGDPDTGPRWGRIGKLVE